MTARPKSLIPLLASLGGLLLVIAGPFALWLHVSGNFYPLIEGQYYRSAQLPPARLEKVIGAYGIQSILNLRGLQPGDAWYDSETALAERLHVAHYDVQLSARRMVPPETLTAILALLSQVPKPVLIHCRGGADRTGLISAILRFEHGDPPVKARRQLGLVFGHFPWLGSKTVAMDQSFDAFLRVDYALAAANPSFSLRDDRSWALP
jgi:protein tyrosine phosphatase (PTP) superfamily phosphohydrolase (DUF442 family)